MLLYQLYCHWHCAIHVWSIMYHVCSCCTKKRTKVWALELCQRIKIMYGSCAMYNPPPPPQKKKKKKKKYTTTSPPKKERKEKKCVVIVHYEQNQICGSRNYLLIPQTMEAYTGYCSKKEKSGYLHLSVSWRMTQTLIVSVNRGQPC